MRKVYIDVATTGLVPDFDKVVEIAAIEVMNGKATGIELHYYINPDGLNLHPPVEEINGYDIEFLKDKPRFVDVAKALSKLFRGAELVCFGADFDLAFLKKEFGRLSLSSLDDNCIAVVDLRVLAREIYPNQRRDLATLFEKFELNETNKDLPRLLSSCRRLVQLHQALINLG